MSAVDPAGPTGAGRAGRAVAVQAALLGLALSLLNGFVVASLQGAVGVVGREQTMLRIWVGVTAAMLPVYAGVTYGVLRLVARRRAHRSGGRSIVTIGLVAAAGAVVGTLTVVGFAVRDVRVQDAQVESVAWTHFHTAGSDPATYGGSAGCDAICVVEQHTRDAHVRAVVRAVPVLAGLDAFSALWLLAAFGGSVALPAAGARRRRAVTLTDLSELVGTR